MNSAPVIVFLAVLIYGLIHSVMASLSAKSKAQHWFGLLGRRMYRLAYNVLAVISLVPVAVLPFLLPDRHLYTVPIIFLPLTLGLQLFSVLVVLAGIRQTGTAYFLGLAQLQKDAQDSEGELQHSGIYRYIRHPLYTGGLGLIWFFPYMTANLLALFAGFTLYIMLGIIFEERKLLHEFGDAYLRYRRQTPMLLPGLKLLQRHNDSGN